MDVSSLFKQAEALFQAGQLADALAALDRIERVAGGHAAVFHLRALVEKKLGAAASAERSFVSALALAPRDPQINNNYANLLSELARHDEALDHYRVALAANPGYVDAKLNEALLLQKMGRIEEALQGYRAVLAREPANVRAHSANASALREMARFAEAAASYDRALAVAPRHPRALAGRARIALETGAAGAAAHYRRALTVQPDDRDLILGLAEALLAEGDESAIAYLAAAVEGRPEWFEGQERLAEMRAETGEPGDALRGYADALARHPGSRPLHASHWGALARAGRHADALEAIARARAALGEDRDMRVTGAAFVTEAGDAQRALHMLAGLNGGADLNSVRARALLRLGDARQAAALYGEIVSENRDDIAAWAHLALAWRVLGDARHDWLCGQPGLFGTVELGLGDADLDALAALLRTLHRTRAHPIGQSLRGGTQTRGRLFWRGEPEIAGLHSAIDGALQEFAANLPPTDERHPLLRHRDRTLIIEGSWSVRLQSSGFHVNHIHPHGLLSSACYIALPPGIASGDRQGWLELGAPPVELGLDLPPLAVIEPRPGRLALFPSYLFHGTLPFSSGERLTVAFDAVADAPKPGPG